MLLARIITKFLKFYLICYLSISIDTSLAATPTSMVTPSLATTTWNLNNVDLRQVIDMVAKITHKNFLLDDKVKGKITIITQTPLTADEVYPVFLSALQSAGFSAIAENNIIHIVPNDNSRISNAPVVTTSTSLNNGEIVVQVIPIRYVSAMQLIPILRPLLPSWAQLNAYTPSNQLIIAGDRLKLARIQDIIKQVDIPTYRGIHIIPLHYIAATELVTTLKALELSNQFGNNNAFRLAADERSNSILLNGSVADRMQLQVLIAQLDSPKLSQQNATVQIVKLQFVTAGQLIPILAGIAKSHFHGIVETAGTETLSTNDNSSNDTSTLHAPSPPTIATNLNATTVDNQQPRIAIIAEPNSNSVVLNAPLPVMQLMKTAIKQLDVRPAQVAVEALIAEINEDDVDHLGIDWGTLAQPTDGLLVAGFQPGMGIITERGFRSFQAVLATLVSTNKADILATPSVVVLNNHTAHIKVGKEVSVEDTVYPGNNNGAGTANPFITLKRLAAALLLNVTPQISQSEAITLNIMHTNNTLQDPNDNSGKPIFNISEINTSVLVNNGNILVLGGLIQNELREVDRKVNILGDIPLVGEIFHHKTKTHDKKKLMIFLRPRILRNAQDSRIVSQAPYRLIRQAQLDWLQHQGYLQLAAEHTLPQLKPAPVKRPTVKFRKPKRLPPRGCRGGLC